MTATRRLVVTTTGTAVAGALAGCGGGATSPSSPTPTAAPTLTGQEARVPLMGIGETVEASLNLVGNLVTPLAVTRLAATEVVAVSRICTHMGCTVALPSAAGETLDCPCHGSRYRTNGQVVNGPAVRALASFPASIQGNVVVIKSDV